MELTSLCDQIVKRFNESRGLCKTIEEDDDDDAARAGSSNEATKTLVLDQQPTGHRLEAKTHRGESGYTFFKFQKHDLKRLVYQVR